MKHTSMKLFLLVSIILLTSLSHAIAQEFLATDQIKALFVGKTIHAEHLKKGFEFKVYFDPDGKTALREQNGETAKTTYKIENDTHCMVWQNKKRCARIRDNEDGTYTRVNPSGKSIIKWTKIVSGNEL